MKHSRLMSHNVLNSVCSAVKSKVSENKKKKENVILCDCTIWYYWRYISVPLHHIIESYFTEAMIHANEFKNRQLICLRQFAIYTTIDFCFNNSCYGYNVQISNGMSVGEYIYLTDVL